MTLQLRMRDVLAQLNAEGLATPGADDLIRAELRTESDDDMPWYVRIAVGLGAWIATWTLFGLIGALVGLDDAMTRLVLGLLLVSGAVVLRRGSHAEFLRQASVAAALAGHGLVLTGVGDLVDSAEFTGIAGVVLSALLIWLFPDRIYRFLSAMAGAVCWLVFAYAMELPYGFEIATLGLVALTAYVWRGKLRDLDPMTEEMLEPVKYALVVTLFGALLIGEAYHFGGGGPARDELQGVRLGPLTTIGITLALVALVWKIIDEQGASHGSVRSFAALAGAAALGAGALSTPGIVAGAAVLTLAFDRRDKVLLGMAVVFLLVFGSVYYYSLNLTLLEKSGVLAGSGVLLLAIRRRLAPRDHEKVAPA